MGYSNVSQEVKNWIGLAVLVIPVLYLKYFGIPVQRGFFCDDESLRYPKLAETVNSPTMWCLAYFIPCLTMMFNEGYLRHRRNLLHNKWHWRSFVIDLYRRYFIYTFGLMSALVLINTCKYGVGRLRPHFIERCAPVDPNTGRSLSNCSNLADPHMYIQKYLCSNGEYWNLRLSFFSGHSAIFAYSMLYTAMYLQVRVPLNEVGMLRPMYQVLCIFLCIFVALTRIWDYFHHPTDVFTGLFVGTTFSILTFVFLSDYCDRNNRNLPLFITEYENMPSDYGGNGNTSGKDADVESLTMAISRSSGGSKYQTKPTHHRKRPMGSGHHDEVDDQQPSTSGHKKQSFALTSSSEEKLLLSRK